jgi:hypothetical protein
LNPRPSGYEPDELPGCSTPRLEKRIISNRGRRASVLFCFGNKCLDERVRNESVIIIEILQEEMLKTAHALLKTGAWERPIIPVISIIHSGVCC